MYCTGITKDPQNRHLWLSGLIDDSSWFRAAIKGRPSAAGAQWNSDPASMLGSEEYWCSTIHVENPTCITENLPKDLHYGKITKLPGCCFFFFTKVAPGH